MGYFPNGTSGEIYSEMVCSRCVHFECCAVWEAHLLRNYEESGNDNSILHILIPKTADGAGNEQCRMFYEHPNAPDPNQLNLFEDTPDALQDKHHGRRQIHAMRHDKLSFLQEELDAGQ